MSSFWRVFGNFAPGHVKDYEEKCNGFGSFHMNLSELFVVV